NIIPSPDPGSHGSYLSGVAVVSANDVWAVGTYDYGGGYLPRTLVEHWNGSVWSIIASPNIDANMNNLYDVGVVSANEVWAVGNTEDQNGVYNHTMGLRWNGRIWRIVHSPNAEG